MIFVKTIDKIMKICYTIIIFLKKYMHKYTIKKARIFLILLIVLLIISICPVAVSAEEPVEFLDISVEEIDGKTVNVIWRTNTATRGKIDFGETSSDLHYYIVDGDSYKEYHKVELANLKPEATYYYQITAYNGGEQVKSFIRSFKTDEYNDGFPPKITNLAVPYISGTAAFVSWTTNENSSSVVEYGIGESYSSRKSSRSRVKYHKIILKNLKPNKDYFLRVYSTDKDGNKGLYQYKSFRTLPNNKTDKEDLEISYFRPSSYSDSQITADSIVVSFRTNHYAYGKISLRKKGTKTQSQELKYNSYHQVNFSGLSPESEYTISISMTDIFGKKVNIKNYKIRTKSIEAASKFVSQGDITNYCGDKKVNQGWEQCDGGTGCTEQCQKDNQNINNLVLARVNINNVKNWDNGDMSSNIYLGLDSRYIPNETWFALYWNGNYYADPDIANYEDVPGLAVQRLKDKVRIVLHGSIKNSKESVGGNIEFYNAAIINQEDEKVKDNILEKGFDNKGKGKYNAGDDEVWLKKGDKTHSYFWLTTTSADDGFYTNFKINDNINTGIGGGEIDYQNGDYNSGNNNGNGVIVAGAEYSYYTEISAIYKTPDSPNIYVIMNGQRHYISSPTSFNKYGLRWQDVRTVSRGELEQYPRARLITSPEDNTIYYLYQRPENQWLKINITSPTVFISYPKNHWGNVIKVTEEDVNSYPDVKLIKTKDNSDIYYLKDNNRHLVTSEVFKIHGFNIYEIAEVNETHMESYKLSEPLQ